MFSKQSRYHAVPDVAGSRRDRRSVVGKDLRVLPNITGSFTHTIGDGDRLDQLAFQYYGQPLHYWRICDANPDFLSPLALIGQEPLVAAHYTVAVPEDGPSWGQVLATLSAMVGVQDVIVRHDVTTKPAVELAEGEEVTVVAEHTVPVVTVMYNRVAVDGDAISGTIEQSGLTVTSRSETGQTGRQIVIPAAARG
ncbi:tail protein X [Streptomyces iakyrus]|uniref:tail protein X n=1 Tax=Streptomyces iakyrus TaxID=68219 RepID=UPI003805820A